jgi:hypothetical protein
VGHDLDVLLADGIIDEVLGRLKSGKEADISLVRRGEHVLAAKVYKDRATRSFKNNADYKEGRTVRNSRTQRAIDGGGRFGRDAAEQAWKSAEADALGKLVGSGVRVPQPVMFYEGVLLMELVVDAEGRAGAAHHRRGDTRPTRTRAPPTLDLRGAARRGCSAPRRRPRRPLAVQHPRRRRRGRPSSTSRRSSRPRTTRAPSSSSCATTTTWYRFVSRLRRRRWRRSRADGRADLAGVLSGAS